MSCVQSVQLWPDVTRWELQQLFVFCCIQSHFSLCMIADMKAVAAM